MKKILSLLILLFVLFAANAQTQTISGTVSEASGEPLVGVSILVKGTTYGTVTDMDGNFTMRVAEDATTLVVSYIGMKTLELPIQAVMEIVMQPDAQSMDEVMVVAYGVAQKGSYAGSASLVNADDIKDVPTTSFQNALNGKVSGVQVTTSSGEAGSAPSIRIRGIGSMNASNEPLYVVDGVPVVSGDVGQMSAYTYSTNNIMNTLNPDDIESISVLKDAAASSLYGSRAANGVILITTKKGKTGKSVIGFKASVGFTPSFATDNYEAASTEESVKMLYMVFHDYRTSGGYSDETANEYALYKLNQKFNKHGYAFSTSGTALNSDVTISDYDNSGRAGNYFDWDDAYFRTAMYQTYDLSVSGGEKNTNYYTSFSYTKDEGRIKVNGFDRIAGRVNVNQKVGKLDLGVNVNIAKTSQEGFNDTRSTGSNYFYQTRNLLWGLYYPTDYSTGEAWTSRYGSYAYNGLYYDKEWENESENLRMMANVSAALQISPCLDIRSIFSFDNTAVNEHVYYSANHYNGSAENGEVNELRTTYQNWVSSTTANFNKSLGVHSFGALVGVEATKNTTDYVRATGTDLPNSSLHTVATAGTQTSTAYDWGNSMISLLSKIDYSYDQKYFASASFRRDGSSKLSEDARWGNFWSLAASWRMSEEDFLKDHPVISDLKLRASYGVNGTLPTDNYGYMSLMGYTAQYMSSPGATINSVANGDLSWETSYTYNIGVDYGLFANRVRGSLEYFNRDSKDLLQDVPISTVTGFSSTLQNLGEINNSGIEIEIGGDILRNKNGWNLSASVNAAFLQSEVTELYNGSDIIWYDPTGDDNRAMYIYREGESTLAFYGYEWAGVDPSNGASVYYTNDGTDGDFLYNGRGATYDYDNASYTIIGDAIPDVSGGFNINTAYKGFDLALNFIYKIGGELYDGAYKDVADDGYYWERFRAKSYYENMWTEENPNGTQPKIRGVDLTDAMQYSSRHICDASFLRLKSMSLGYSLPKNLISKAKMSQARIYCNVSNLLTFSKYKEADPEVNPYGTRGWETPIGKTYVLGIDIKF